MPDRDELAKRIERGDYKVDPHAVAEAMLKRNPLMLVPAQPLDRPPVRAEQDKPAPDPDLA
jgi:Anti-sigma-28 factor, FlgM